MAPVRVPVVLSALAVVSLALGAAMAARTSTVDATLLGQIFANPSGYYVNIHTGDFPNGAAGGQLQRNR
jgi:hypothetical protein